MVKPFPLLAMKAIRFWSTMTINERSTEKLLIAFRFERQRTEINRENTFVNSNKFFSKECLLRPKCTARRTKLMLDMDNGLLFSAICI